MIVSLRLGNGTISSGFQIINEIDTNKNFRKGGSDENYRQKSRLLRLFARSN